MNFLWRYAVPASMALTIGTQCEDLGKRVHQLAQDIQGAVVLHSISPEQMLENDLLVKEAAAYATNTGKCAIAVYKVPRLMSVFCGGHEEVFDVELGRSPYQDKMKEGDMATPEGWYAIARISERPGAKFSHALYLDYPRPRDHEEFEEAQRSGLVGPKDTIGGAVQIHGGGGRGYDFTGGCIALKNPDLDVLMGYAKEGRISAGTPVVVVKATSESL